MPEISFAKYDRCCLHGKVVVPVKLPRREFRETREAGDAPLELPLGDEPLGEPPFGERPRGGDVPLRKTSLSAGSGTEAKRAEVNTWVGCRNAPPSPFTTRCSGSYGWRLASPDGWAGGIPEAARDLGRCYLSYRCKELKTHFNSLVCCISQQ